MVLLAPSISALRKLIGVCEDYAASHRLMYNVKKTEYMVFGVAGKKSPNNVLPISLNGILLKKVTHFKYLGHYIADDLKDNMDIERERRALTVKANMLARRFARCTVEVKVTIFWAYCTPLYAGVLWASYTQVSLRAMRSQYNNDFRTLMRLPRFCSASAMFAEARVDSFMAVLRKRSASMLNRIRGSGNSLLKTIATVIPCEFGAVVVASATW
ncbi:uncharacterized protein LOC113238824 [Hyposmocoma kahamanoa]|uniref:uncharacterized protein LOC113238824 n=1 Tax=Hyposmocoma kahamanoa TaxID=1477025 RepID=UPI000E6D8864|nr:uncharacterized protein LOC113238824 [Hyposmocoma kahamanoa]